MSRASLGDNIHGDEILLPVRGSYIVLTMAVALLLKGMGRMIGSPDCTPGYYNNEGQDPGPAARLNVGYPAGASAYFRYLAGWRESGRYEGLAFR